MDWVDRMRRGQRAIAEKMSPEFIDMLFKKHSKEIDEETVNAIKEMAEDSEFRAEMKELLGTEKPTKRQLKQAAKDFLKKELGVNATEIVERLSWSVAETVFANPDAGWKKIRGMVCTGMSLHLYIDSVLQKVSDKTNNELHLVKDIFAWLAKNECKLPNVGRLFYGADGRVRLVLDRRGLKKIKKLLEVEAELDREAKACANNPPAPGMITFDDIGFEDEEEKEKKE